MAEPPITIVGLGITAVDQVTREVDAALRRCREVLYVEAGLGVQAYLEQRCPRVTALFAESYRDGAHRPDRYQHMAARVLDAALDHAPVVFAMAGHPLVFSYPAQLVHDGARALGLSVRVLPGISAFDCIFAELMIDPAAQGMQMVEATDLLLRQRPLQPDMPALIWQIGNVETRLHSTAPSRPERFDRLVGWLTRFYPTEHVVTAIFVSPFPLVPTVRYNFALGQMRDYADRLHVGFTLYVPPVGARPIFDADLLRAMDSPDHLRRITSSG